MRQTHSESHSLCDLIMLRKEGRSFKGTNTGQASYYNRTSEGSSVVELATGAAARKLSFQTRFRTLKFGRAQSRSVASGLEVGWEAACCARPANCVLNWVCCRTMGSRIAARPPTEAPKDEGVVRFVGQAPGVVVRQTPDATCCVLCCWRRLLSLAAFQRNPCWSISPHPPFFFCVSVYLLFSTSAAVLSPPP